MIQALGNDNNTASQVSKRGNIWKRPGEYDNSSLFVRRAAAPAVDSVITACRPASPHPPSSPFVSRAELLLTRGSPRSQRALARPLQRPVPKKKNHTEGLIDGCVPLCLRSLCLSFPAKPHPSLPVSVTQSVCVCVCVLHICKRLAVRKPNGGEVIC